MAEEKSLEILLAATARGDHAAFADLYAATAAHLYGVALRIVLSHDLAEDVLQEAFVRIWDNARSYRADRGTPMTWMMTVVRNRAIDKRRQRRPESMPADDWEGVDDAPSPLDWAIAGAEAARLRGCLEVLGEQQRACILYAYVEGYTHQELATRMDCPLGTVKSWIRRGLVQLKDCLTP